jgi:hypothetical protein
MTGTKRVSIDTIPTAGITLLHFTQLRVGGQKHLKRKEREEEKQNASYI